MKQVKSLTSLSGLLTKDRIYTVLEESNINFVIIIDDRGERCVYDAKRFEVVLAPQVAPDFRQMQQIADGVKFTRTELGDVYHDGLNRHDAGLPTVPKQALESSLTDQLAAANEYIKKLEATIFTLEREVDRLNEIVNDPGDGE